MEIVGKLLPKEICDKIQDNVHMLKCLEHTFPNELTCDIRQVGNFRTTHENGALSYLNDENRKIAWMTNYIKIRRTLHGSAY